MSKKDIFVSPSAAAPVFQIAPIDVRDLRACLEINPYHIGSARLGEAQALKLWKQLLAMEDACSHALVSRKKQGAAREIIAVGIGVFVTNEFAAMELARPRPGLNARILESLAANKSVIPDYRYLARANGAGTLQQVIMYTSTRSDLLSPDEETLVRGLLSRNYAEQYAGYRIQRMLTEVYGSADLAALAGYPSIVIASQYEDYYRETGVEAGENALGVATATTFKADPSSAATPVFLGQTIPRFDFSRAEKNLLKGALHGLDDAQLAESLCRTPSAMKRRWRRIFEKIANVDPRLCPDADGPARGPQRRHHVLNYLRKHPEELRPFSTP